MYNNLPALIDSILWDEQLLAGDYTQLSESVFHDTITAYLAAVDSMRGEWHPKDSSPLGLYIAYYEDLPLYRNGLLCTERVLLNDELFDVSLHLQRSSMDMALDQFIHEPDRNRYAELRQKAAIFVRFVKTNFALIQTGFIAFVRSESQRDTMKRKSQLIEDNAAPHFLKSIMPSNIATLYERSLNVRGLERIGNSNRFRFIPDVQLPNEIMTTLKECLSPYTQGHMYQSIRPFSENEDGTITMEITQGQHTNRRDWAHWVQGATNRTVFYHWLQLLTDIRQARACSSSLGACCPLQGKILQKIDGNSNLTRRMLTVETPFLDGLTLQDIHRIRTDYAPSFTAFQRSLRDCALEMERAKNVDEICLLQGRFHERIMDEGLNDIREKMVIWRRRSTVDTVLLATPVILGFLGAPPLATLASGAASLLQAALSVTRGADEVRAHPSYFIFKTNGKSH